MKGAPLAWRFGVRGGSLVEVGARESGCGGACCWDAAVMLPRADSIADDRLASCVVSIK